LVQLLANREAVAECSKIDRFRRNVCRVLVGDADAVPQLVPCYLDKSGVAFGVDVDSLRLRRDVDAVEDVESVDCWRNWLNVSPEGSLKRLPDSRKSVRQGNGFIGFTQSGPRS